MYRSRDLTALAFHGGKSNGKWVSKARPDITLSDILTGVEKKHPIDVLLVCNPTEEDIARNDLIYMVNNEACPVVRGTSPDLQLGLFPKIHGGGYWSVFGQKYSIPYPYQRLRNLLNN